MSPRILPLLLLALPAAAGEPPGSDPDLLRFTNGDALHGHFDGLENGSVIQWSGTTLQAPVRLQTDKLRRVTLNGGRANKSLDNPSYAQLPNGDRIPGTIVALDENSVTLDSAVAGTLTVPRKHLSAIAPNPHGGALHYIGPFSPDGWTVISPPKKDEARKRKADPDKNQDPDAEAQDEEEEEEPWVFAGGAWYSNGQLPIKVDAKLPDKTRITFQLAWRNRLNAVIAFHATTKLPELDEEDPKEDGEDEEKEEKKNLQRQAIGSRSSSYPITYGHSYVLTIYSSYAMLYRCEFDEDGNAEQTRLSTSSSNIRLDESGEAKFELRCDREANSITLFVDGNYVSQWEDNAGYVGTGSHLAFACQNSSSRLRVSDLVVSSWNGMIDSARSMDADDRDVLLLTNGTDRFSGDLTGLEDGKFHLHGTFADMQIPVDQVQEIRFARNKVAEAAAPSGKAVRLFLQPVGRMTVEPVSATRSRFEAHSPTLGDLKLDLGYASILEFTFGDSILDTWDDDF